jgi:hypothetical protein
MINIQNSTRAKTSSSQSYRQRTDCARRASLFPLPPHHDPAGDIHKYPRHAGACFGRFKERLGLAQCMRWQARLVFSANVHKQLCTWVLKTHRAGCAAQPFVYRVGMIVVAIEVDAVEIDVVVVVETELYGS